MLGNSTKTRSEKSRVQERLVLSLYFLQTQVQKCQSEMIWRNTNKTWLMQWNKNGLARSKVSNNWKEVLNSQCTGHLLFENQENSLKIVYLWLCFVDLWVTACHKGTKMLIYQKHQDPWEKKKKQYKYLYMGIAIIQAQLE